ncbi:MAG: fibronectin/fibrinogen-binding protein [Clostridia bacterium]|nr:fibronectin/fibrinogen-binding protein [Clostridia bacterium]
MGYDGLFTGVITRQLNEELYGAKIEKIYQPEPEAILMQVYANGNRKKLFLNTSSTGASVYLTNRNFENPQDAPSFCMLLRKHLQSGRIVSVNQTQTERVIEFNIDTMNEMGFSVNKKLIAEIMGKHSNLILIDLATDRIIDSIKRISIDVNRYRQLLPGLTYVPPPTQHKLDFWTSTEDDFRKSLSQTGMDGPQAILSSIQGFGPTAAEELWLQGPTEQLASRLSALKSYLLADKSLCPAVYTDETKTPKDVHIFPLKTLFDSSKTKCFDKPGDALDYFFANRMQSNRVTQKNTNMMKDIQHILARLLLKKQRLLEDIQEAEKADIQRLKGELLTANLHIVPPGAKSVIVKSYYDDTDVVIELDVRFSAAKNAQSYYKKYAKAKTAKKEKFIQLEEVQADVEYLESVLSLIPFSETYEELEAIHRELSDLGYIRPLKTKQKRSTLKAKPKIYKTENGFEVRVGRNNTENDYLTFKLASKTDLWFHTKDIPGSHVVLFAENKKPEESDILNAAALAAYHSKAKNSENVPVNYTEIKHVKKLPESKPGMVTFINYKTIYVNPENKESI